MSKRTHVFDQFSIRSNLHEHYELGVELSGSQSQSKNDVGDWGLLPTSPPLSPPPLGGLLGFANETFLMLQPPSGGT